MFSPGRTKRFPLAAVLASVALGCSASVVTDDPTEDTGVRPRADVPVDVAVDAPTDTGRPPTDVPASDRGDTGARADVPITCPMPPPAFVVEGGRCVPSCLAAGGNTCGASQCAGRPTLEAYDCPTCCAIPPANCGGLSLTWVCTPDGRGRQRCVSGAIQTEACARSCLPGSGSGEATCTSTASVCTGSASGSSPLWTCTGDRRSRQRCVQSMTQTEACPNGCQENAVGADDTCASPPSGCAASASGTSSIWTCTADRRSRQRCVGGAVQTEACASGCVPRPLGTDDECATPSSGCSGSASGTSSVWTCTADRRARQRCVGGAVQTEACPYNCSTFPSGADDQCNPMTTPGTGNVSCAYPQWWTLPYSWDPGYYAVRYGWDNDLRMVAGTPVQLRHASRLLAEGVYGWGWMPEFVDTVTGQRFRFLHLQPSRRLTTAIGTTYPAGTLVGYSGGNSGDTGYPEYSTGAHLCVQTQVPYRMAFPSGTEPCR